MKTNRSYKEYRDGADRRKRKIPPLKYLLLGGRRKRIRRKEDENELIILDTHGSGIFALAAIILVLRVIDGLLTLNLIGRGAHEINPVMSYLIKLNPYIYFFTKCFLTGTGVIILILLRNYRSKVFGMRISNILPVLALFFYNCCTLYLAYEVPISCFWMMGRRFDRF